MFPPVRRLGLAVVRVSLVFGVLIGCGSESGSPHTATPTAGSAPVGGAATTAGGGNVGGGGGASAGAAQAGNSSAAGSASGGAIGAGAAGANSTAGAVGTGGVAGAAGTASSCPLGSAAVSPWPGKNQAKTLDLEDQFESDLSGLTFEPAGGGVLWASNNLTGKLFRLVPSGTGFVPDTANGWAAGKALRYPDGQGQPDAEGVTFGSSVADGVYIGSEHDGEDASTSRPSVLRYDVSGAGTSLTATREWNLTTLLPQLGANTGIEGLTWVPDSFLTSHGFLDEAKGHAYVPAEYPNHGSGLFFVGIEESGKLYGFALDHSDGSAVLLATISTPNDGVMGLEFDRDTGNLWFNCDDGCDNESGILRIDTHPDAASRGKFVVHRLFQRPSTLPDANNEGIAIAPNAECSGGFKRFFWTDDSDEDGFSLRSDLIPCDACF